MIEETIRRAVASIERNWPARRWTADMRRDYTEGLRSVGDERAIEEGVTRAVREWGGNFPPVVASLLELVWDAQRQRLEKERDREREKQRGEPEDVAPVWHGWLWHAALIRRFQETDRPTPVPEHISPYLDVVDRHGLRCEHGCGDFRSSDGWWYPADPAYDRARVAAALEDARELFDASGAKDTPRARQQAVAAMVGPGFAKPVDEPYPRGPLNGGPV